MPVDIRDLKRRWDEREGERQQEHVVWDEIEKLIMPLTGQTAQAVHQSTAQQQTDTKLWDLTAPLACEHLAAMLYADVVSPASHWLDLEWMDDELEKDHEAVKHREGVARVCWDELQASDFNMEISSGLHEYVGLGNMCLTSEPLGTNPAEWKGLDFLAIPMRQQDFEEDSKGGIRTWWRKLDWTAAQCKDHCEREKTDVPERIRKRAESNDATKIAVLYCVFRREGIPEESGSDVLVAEKRPFGCVYFTADECEQLGEEGGYYRMPVVVARWARRPGSRYGFGRGHIALRHVKGLNYFKELRLNAAEKAVDPSLGVTERVGTSIDLRPGKATVVPSKDDLWAIESSAHFDVSVDVLRDERTEIRRAFHEDDLQLKESPQMTATEVQARRDQMNRALGAPVGRLQSDALAPIVMIALDHLARAKRLPPPPALVKQKKAEVKLRFRGPVMRAAAMDAVVAIEREAAFISNLLKLGFEDARYYFDLGNAIQEHAKLLGVPASVTVSLQEARKKVEAAQKAQAEAQAAETAKTQGEAAQAAAAASASLAPAGGGQVLPFAPQPSGVPSGVQVP